MSDPRSTRAWRRLRARVIAEEPVCRLRLPDICSRISTTADHVVSVRERPDLALVRSNVRGACSPCNRARGSLPDSVLALEPPSDALRIFE